MSQKPCKGRGVCAVCWLSFKTRASDGAIHRHGHRSDPCLGSKQPPAEDVSDMNAILKLKLKIIFANVI